jgi:threonine/homoserine/homoserine lactone efflux protein
VRRLRVGEWMAGAGAALLLISLFVDWVGPPRESGWSSLGWFTLVWCVVAAAVAAWLVIATALARPLAQMVAACILTATAGTLGFLVLALRVLVFQPGPNDIVVLRYGAYLGLVAALLIAVGGWWAIKDDRTDAPESAYTPPPPRPAPPERAS